MFDKDLFGDDVRPDEHGSTLAKTWEYPPFSVLNAREGWWQERKRQWLALGIKSELGRGGGEQHEPSTAGNEAGRNDGQPAPQRRGGLMAQAFDVRGGLATWQKDKRNGG